MMNFILDISDDNSFEKNNFLDEFVKELNNE